MNWSNHQPIPVSGEKVAAYNRIAAKVTLPWDQEVINEPPLTDDMILDAMESIRTSAKNGSKFAAAQEQDVAKKENSMKTIGLLGGMSWESTLGYYRAINEGVKKALGGLHSAKIAMYSVDFEPIENLLRAGAWESTAKILSEAARKIESAGADFLLICTNTMHRVAPDIEAAIQIPLLHIADATAEILVQEGIQSVGLLGTAFTMEQEFYKGRLTDNYGLTVLVPDEKDRQIVHNVIFQELCMGKIEPASKAEYLRIIDSLASQGAEAVILGCTEIGMLVTQADTDVRLLDTTAVHADKAVAYATS